MRPNHESEQHMVDMLALTSVDTSAAKAPPELPDGVYHVMNVGWKVGPCRFDDNLGTITIEARPMRVPDGAEFHGDITKRRIFKEFHVNPAQVDTYFYLNMYVDACGVDRRGKTPKEYLPEIIGTEATLTHTMRTYTKKKDGTQGTIADVKMVIGGVPITERRPD